MYYSCVPSSIDVVDNSCVATKTRTCNDTENGPCIVGSYTRIVTNNVADMVADNGIVVYWVRSNGNAKCIVV